MSIDMLPTLNAMLNATSGIFLVIGYVMIRRKRVAAHRFFMTAAVTASILFLISYVTYHFGYSKGVTRFQGTGWTRPVYFTILISHTIMAVTIVPFVIITLKRALGEQFARHRQIARWTYPMWLYVSVTGVLVYFMLYHWFPSR